MPHTKAQKFKPQPRLEPALWHWLQAKKADMLTIASLVTPMTESSNPKPNQNLHS